MVNIVWFTFIYCSILASDVLNVVYARGASEVSSISATVPGIML